jgi:hypothetical protein
METTLLACRWLFCVGGDAYRIMPFRKHMCLWTILLINNRSRVNLEIHCMIKLVDLFPSFCLIHAPRHWELFGKKEWQASHFHSSTHQNNKKFWESLLAYFPFTTYWVYDTLRTAQKSPRPTVLLLWRVESLQQGTVFFIHALYFLHKATYLLFHSQR